MGSAVPPCFIALALRSFLFLELFSCNSLFFMFFSAPGLSAFFASVLVLPYLHCASSLCHKRLFPVFKSECSAHKIRKTISPVNRNFLFGPGTKNYVFESFLFKKRLTYGYLISITNAGRGTDNVVGAIVKSI